MTDYVDALIHIADLPALLGWLAENAPGRLDATGTISGFDGTPFVARGRAVVTYARIREADAELFRNTAPGVTVLAEAAFDDDPEETADAVYDALVADPEALALYDAVYDRTPRLVDDGQGGQIEYTPPERLGRMA